MAGLKINICFWYVDDTQIEEIINTLIIGNYDPVFCNCKDVRKLRERLLTGNIDLIISDFDLPETLTSLIEDTHKKIANHVPLIYLVGEKNELKAAETLKRGVWDYVLKSHFVKLVPTVYSSQKFGKVLKHSLKVEGELEESETKYHSIFNTVKDGIVIIDADDLDIINFNDSTLKLFGLSDDADEEFVRKFISCDKNYCRSKLEDVSRSISDDQSVIYLCLNTRFDGTEFWSENTLSVFKFGDIIQFVLVIRDIQEQKTIEKSLKDSKELFQNLAENSPDIIMRFDKQYRHVYVNQAAEVLVGIPVKDFLDRTHKEMGVFPEDMVRFWEHSMEQVFSSGEPHTVEFDLQTKTDKLSFEWRLFPESDGEGNTQTLLAIARDITESRKSGIALKNSEERLKHAVEATSLGLWDWNLESDVVYFSPVYFRMLGYQPDELPQSMMTLHKLIHKADQSRYLKATELSIENPSEDFEMEFRMLCKDGRYKWVLGKGRAINVNEEGRTIRLIGTHEDISGRKRNEEIQEMLFHISNAVNTTKNLNELYEKIRDSLGNVVDTTNCFLALYHEHSNMLTMPFHRDEVDSFSEFPAGKTLTGYVISTGKAQLIDAEIEKRLTEEGQIEPVGSPCISWLGVPLKTNDKTIGVFVVQSYSTDTIYTQEDVSILEFVSDQIALAIERKRDQDNIRENQERQRRIFESSPDPIIVVDPNGIILDYNTSLLPALNISNEPVIGQNIFHFIHRTDWRNGIRNFKRTWETGYIKNLELKVKRADGSCFDSEVSTGSIFNKDGEPESMVIILKNISDRKEAERRLREAKEKAEESDRLKTAFLSNMSHEIRTPMNAIVGFSDLLNDPSISAEERSEFIAQINLGADNLMHLIDDIIDIAKIEAGQIKINNREASLDKILNEQMVMFRQNIERMDKSNIDFRLNWSWPEETLVLITDPFRVKQIISNLLNNAIKFTDEGFIELGLEDKGDYIRIYVKDSGIGISEEKQDIIFDRFMQGHKSKTKLYGGTGLGLAISKNLTDLLGGEIGVISKQNEGSEFWFTLPANGLRNKDSEEEFATKEETTGLDDKWMGKKILVAEDDVSNFKLISEALKPTKAELIWAKNGLETIKLFEELGTQLNLVLMDIQMPDKDGYECTRFIKESNPNIPVIAQTAYAMSGEKELCMEAGCDGYLSKPLQISSLIKKLGYYIK